MPYKYRKFSYLTKIGILILIIVSLGYIFFSNPKNISTIPTINKATPIQEQAVISDTVFSASGKHPYKIIAKEVTHNRDGTYFLNTVSGSYSVDAVKEININAGVGYFDSSLNHIELKNNVKIGYLGYDLIGEEIKVDLTHHSANSNHGVHMWGEKGTIEAQNFETTEDFNQITFHGNVKANFIINSGKH